MSPPSSPPQPHSASPILPSAASPPPAPSDLTNWFLNAKRSLSSITLCSRAHDLVNTARTALHDASVMSARCIFLRNALHDQLILAGHVNRVMHATQDGFRTEFEKTLNELDNADLRLNETLELLRNSVVDPAFFEKPPAPAEGADAENGEASGNAGQGISPDESLQGSNRVRTLHDFVEDEGIENLKTKLRHSIDDVQESHDAIQGALASFDADISELSAALANVPDLTAPAHAALSGSLHPVVHLLEEHTEAMAALLESLTQHYDRCSTALKDNETPTLSLEEKHELYAILHTDAAEVDDACAEIRDRLSEMETLSATTNQRLADLSSVSDRTSALFNMFEAFARNLLAYVDAQRSFAARQDELREGMHVRLEELQQLGEFYERFVGAYDAMIIEVARRKGVATRREALLHDTMRKLERLYEEDLAEREGFREEFGQWLPVDIWPGIADLPIRYRVERDLQGGRELPRLGKEVVERALRRMQEAAARGR